MCTDGPEVPYGLQDLQEVVALVPLLLEVPATSPEGQAVPEPMVPPPP